LGIEVLKPGAEGWIQLELEKPVVAIRGDRYILRRPSPGETLGGGVVVDPAPKRRHKRFNQAILERLERLSGGTPADILLQSLLSAGISTVREMVAHASLEADTADLALQELLDTNRILTLNQENAQVNSNTIVVAAATWADLKNKLEVEISNYHSSYPLRQGMPREELKSRLKLTSRVFNRVLEKILEEGTLVEIFVRQNLPGLNPTPVISKPGHQVQFNHEQKIRVDRLLTQFKAQPHMPPTIKTCIEEIGEELFHALVDMGRLMPVSSEVVYHWDDYQNLVAEVRRMIEQEGSISVAQMRDRFKTSRRYVLAFLEHLDSINLTVRDGDVRRLK
jgi:selenocysteine-specific elongation factor